MSDFGDQRIIVRRISCRADVLKNVDVSVYRHTNGIGVVEMCVHLDARLVRFFDDRTVVLFGEPDPYFDDVDAPIDEFTSLLCGIPR